MNTYDVTVINSRTGERKTVRVQAENERRASRCEAMVHPDVCAMRIDGAMVEYEITEVKP